MKLKILISYFVYQENKVNLVKALDAYRGPDGPELEILCDSGAYSAFNQGYVLGVEKYADWLLEHKHLLHSYMNLDVKGASSWAIGESLRNLHYLESRGLSPIPVYHGGEPWSLLSDLCKQYPYVALGGIAGDYSSDYRKVRAWLTKCYDIAKPQGTVFHVLGLTKTKLLFQYPIYSADSSTWMGGVKFGTVPVFDATKGDILRYYKSHPLTSSGTPALIKTYGLDYRELHTPGTQRSACLALGLLSFLRLEAYSNRVHGDIPKKDDPNHPGFRLYIVADLQDKAQWWGRLKPFIRNTYGTSLQGGTQK